MRNVINEKKEPWRDLVTTGHVWQARLNDCNPTGYLGFLIIISLVIFAQYNPASSISEFDKFLASPIHYFKSDDHTDGYHVFGDASFQIADDVDYKKVTKRKALEKFVAAQLKSLNENDKLIAKLPYGVLEANQTFKDPDVVNIKTASDGSIFIGGILRTDSYRTYSLSPWVAVFHKKKDGEWEIRELVGGIGIDKRGFSMSWIAPLIDETFFSAKNNDSKGEK